MSDEEAKPAVVRIAPEALSAEALSGLVQEFVTRDGTDYGEHEQSLETKRRQVEAQITSGEVAIVYDPDTETANLVPARELDED